jgi:hypothetical protein
VTGAYFQASDCSTYNVCTTTSGSTFVQYGDPVISTSRIASLLGNVGGQPMGFTAGSGYTPGTYISTAVCTSTVGGSVLPKVDVTVGSAGSIVNVYGSTAADAMGLAIGGGCTFAVPAGAGAGTGGAITAPVVAPIAGAYGIATYNTDSELMGELLYDNSGFPGNPLNQFFTNSFGGYFEPGLPVMPWGNFLGSAVSG